MFSKVLLFLCFFALVEQLSCVPSPQQPEIEETDGPDVTDEPDDTTDEPDVTDEPDDATDGPDDATDGPDDTTDGPDDATDGPDDATDGPDATDAAEVSEEPEVDDEMEAR